MTYASDHRGQPLHAGKRTMDSMRLLYPGGAAYNFGDSVGVVTPTATGEGGEERFEAHLLDSPGYGGPMRDIEAVDRAIDDADRDKFGIMGGANRSNMEQKHSLTMNEGRTQKQRGFRTEKRAEIALGAYKKRLDDGRDPDTGKDDWD